MAKAKKEALRDGAEYLLETANRTAPIEEGTLIREADVSVDRDQASVYYPSIYAPRQHEETLWRHSSGRRAKWLEMTCREEAMSIGRVLGASIRAKFR